ncbi:MAG TPA: type IV pilus assembly protein PilM [Candidatus Saccharimonadales bacterium]|jgi:type IV pilus assembly protein PilM|nr:type IV pilus assembly protein PilM [Candidatus Saccharimonadales bacterium]
MKTTKTPNFFHDKPLFGLDIGHGSLKVMQVEEQPIGTAGKKHLPKVIGYGFAAFDGNALEDGVVIKHEVIAKAAHELFNKHLIGDITTRRVAIAIPAYRTFTRSLKLPKLKQDELAQAVQLEAEQYISAPLEELYLDYEIIRQDDDSTELFVVAVPQNIVDSYLELAEVFGLETVLIEPTLSSSGRLFSVDDQSDLPTVMIDFGALSADISIFDQGHVLVTGTVQGGGENFTNSIMQKLDINQKEAGLVKTRYGLGASKRQSEIRQALEPTLQQIVKEIRRMIRYYEERYGSDRPIKQIVTCGGGANMPGLSEYFTEAVRLAVRHTDPWQYLNYKGFQPPANADKPMYTTVAGLSLARSKEVFS